MLRMKLGLELRLRQLKVPVIVKWVIIFVTGVGAVYQVGLEIVGLLQK